MNSVTTANSRFISHTCISYFGIATLTANLIRNCCKAREHTQEKWAKERKELFEYQENFP